MIKSKWTWKCAAILFLVAACIGYIRWNGNALEQSDPDTSAIVSANAATGDHKAKLDGIQGVWISFHDYQNAGLYSQSRTAFTANADAYFKNWKKTASIRFISMWFPAMMPFIQVNT